MQVTKDPIGHKGARLTSQVSLPGRYLVYVPGASMTGISRKLPDTERTRLKQILKKVMPEDAGVIVRTAAEGAAEEELARDVARLAAQWEEIEKKAKTATAPALLYGEPDLTIRVIRDVFNEDFSQLIVVRRRGLGDRRRVRQVRRAATWPTGSSRWTTTTRDVFAAYRVDEQLAKALDRKVWLPSGGSLVIDRTEAMTVIDVNTGKFTGQGGNLGGDRHPEQPRGRRGDRPPAPAARRRRHHRHRLHRHGAREQPGAGAAPAARVPGPGPDQAPGGRGHLAGPGADDPQAGRRGPARGLLGALRVLQRPRRDRHLRSRSRRPARRTTCTPAAQRRRATAARATAATDRGGGGPAQPGAPIAARIRTDGNGQASRPSPADERNPDGPGTNGQAETAAAEPPDSQPEPARSGNGRRRRRRPAGAAGSQPAVVPDR